MSAVRPGALLEQELALSAYLDSLLEAPPPAPVPSAPPRETPPAPARPAWGAAPFLALQCHCAGLRLAVPLVSLQGVLEWEGRAAALPGQSPWIRGLLRHRGVQLKLVEGGRVVLPAGRRPSPPARGRVLVFGGAWGLVFESVGEVMELEPQGVQWRSRRTRRRWLAGTAVDQLCAVLDLEALAALLETGADPADF